MLERKAGGLCSLVCYKVHKLACKLACGKRLSSWHEKPRINHLANKDDSDSSYEFGRLFWKRQFYMDFKVARQHSHVGRRKKNTLAEKRYSSKIKTPILLGIEDIEGQGEVVGGFQSHQMCHLRAPGYLGLRRTIQQALKSTFIRLLDVRDSRGGESRRSCLDRTMRGEEKGCSSASCPASEEAQLGRSS